MHFHDFILFMAFLNMGNNQNLRTKSRIIKKKLKIGPILKVLTLKFSQLLK